MILPKITSDLATLTLNAAEWPHNQGIVLADPHFMKPGQIDMLFGMDCMDRSICTELRKGPSGTLMTQKTIFGWMLFGSVDTTASFTCNLQSLHYDVQLDRALTKLWKLEEPPRKPHLTYEERFYEDHFDSTHQRTPEGRFEVELPLKPNLPLGESRSFAVRNLLCIERNFAGNENLQSSYNDFMRKLIEMGHMEAVSETTREATDLQLLQRNVSEILKGGFELRKWAPNCIELNESISNASKGISHYIIDEGRPRAGSHLER